jgi:tRNA nucleotidyltransferase (CCA-adding enzyme)
MHTNDIFEAPQKTAVVAFGRMNPPTIGHRKLVDAMLAQAGDPFLFLSHTQKPATDPLSFEEKAGFAKAFFPEVTVGDSQVRTFFDAIKYVNSLGYNRLIYVAGSDRVEQFTKLAIQYNGHDDMYKFDDIQVVSAGQRDPDADGAEGMSASKMRAAALAGDLASFTQGVPNPDVAQAMYDKVRSGMNILERVNSVLETLRRLNQIRTIDPSVTRHIVEQINYIKQSFDNDTQSRELNEDNVDAYYDKLGSTTAGGKDKANIDKDLMKSAIIKAAKDNGIDPAIALRVWQKEGQLGYQSTVERTGKGSLNGREASFGPFQLYTGIGLGNEYEKKYNVKLVDDNTQEGILRQIKFAMAQAAKSGWRPWKGAAHNRPMNPSISEYQGITITPKIANKIDVKSMQQALVDQGADIKADGLMGPNTRAAMAKYNVNRNDYRQTVDKLVGGEVPPDFTPPEDDEINVNPGPKPKPGVQGGRGNINPPIGTNTGEPVGPVDSADSASERSWWDKNMPAWAGGDSDDTVSASPSVTIPLDPPPADPDRPEVTARSGHALRNQKNAQKKYDQKKEKEEKEEEKKKEEENKKAQAKKKKEEAKKKKEEAKKKKEEEAEKKKEEAKKKKEEAEKKKEKKSGSTPPRPKKKPPAPRKTPPSLDGIRPKKKPPAPRKTPPNKEREEPEYVWTDIDRSMDPVVNEVHENVYRDIFSYTNKKYPTVIGEAKLSLPDLETGDELMVGKFKNRKATIKDFTKDKHNQPVAVTDKGEQQIFKGRVKKLMPTEESASWIKEIVNTQSRVNEADTLTLPSIIDDTVVTLGKLFAKNNYEIRIVGGAVRDVALGRTPKDIDLATDATPTEMQSMFDSAGIRHIPTGIEHGTITAVIDSEPYEITTLRADKTTDGRHAEVEFVRSWEEDAKRRDLTYNAMSLDMEGNVHDYFGGMDDLQDKVSKFVGDPQARIQEDYLRILRYFRFQSKLDTPTFDKETIDAIAKNAKGLTQISAERIWQEMSKLLVSPGMADAISWIGKTGVAKYIGLDVTGTPKQFDNPIIALANIISDASLGSKWKLSNSDKELLTFLIKNKLTKIDQNQAEDLVAGGIPDAYIQALATLQNVNLQPVSVPEFPVTGKDLIAIGIKSGPNLGIQLAQLKQIWQQSRFKASKEDLLKNLADVVEGKSPHKKGTPEYNKHMAAMHAGMKEAAEDIAEDGIIVKGVNTTPDVGPNEIKVQASKMGFKVDKGGRPPLLHTKAAKNSDPNTLFNLGLTESVDYVKPQFDVEWEEANRYPYLEKLGQAGWEELAGAGKVITVNTNSVKNIENTGADGSEALDDLEPEKVARLKQAMDAGTIEMPIVVKQSDGSYSLVAGNTRLIGLITTYGKAKVWLVDASNLAEGQLTERGSIGVPLSSGITVGIAPHRELKIKKSTPGKLSYNENVEVDISGNAEKGYVLSKIVVPKELRGTGVGSKVMKDLIDKADMEGAIIALTPDTAFGGSKGRLIQFYKSFGFVPNKGRNKDFRYRETMIRYPKT